ncbi:Nucleotide-binding [Penicillium brevicompactum]|uniref:uncharacterized protein n=1 Tax=Penicillium brevicompactum TaxID=5074 RepID=UPI00253FB588|nr:uncharacterized protein N7506_004951 [Penicillium brevicompactum]KAJ5336929.1 hypothetical protein N7506_004951 [Penicillium brevicompactum]
MNDKAPQNGSTAAVKAASTNQTESHIPQDIAADDTMPGNGSHQPKAADITTILHQVAGPASIPTARPQLRNQEITAENAQSFFVSDALVFIGSLDKRFGDAALTKGSHDAMDKYGRCYIQIKKTQENMPYGFVQYETVEAAEAALTSKDKIFICGREARLEKGGASSTAHIGYCNGRLITIPDIEKLLHDFGHLKEVHIIRADPSSDRNTNYGVVNFTFYGDFANAVAVFKANREVYLHKAPKPASMDNNNTNTRQHRGWNSPTVPSRGNYGRAKSNRQWPSNGHGNGNGNGGNGANNGRGGYRNVSSHRSSFSSQNTNQSYNGQNFPSRTPPPHQYNGGNQHGPGYSGGNTFNQGYNPRLSPTIANFPQGHVINNPPQAFPQGYPPVGLFPGAPMFINQAVEGPPVLDYAGMVGPGLPVYLPGPYPPGSLPPMMAQPQPAIYAPMSPYAVGLDPYRAPPRPNEPLIVSSQPQYDTDNHKELYYYPPNQRSSGMAQPWFDPANPYYMQQEYNQHPTHADYQYGQQMMDPSYPAGYPDASAYDPTQGQARVASAGSQETERGRHYQGHHAMGDGGSDTPPAVPNNPPSELAVAADSTQTGNSSLTHAEEPIEAHRVLNEPENDPKNAKSKQVESTVPEPTDASQIREEPPKETSSEIQNGDTEHEKSELTEIEHLRIERKSSASNSTSDEASGIHTPESDSDQPRERATVSTAPRDISPSTVIAQPVVESQSSSDPLSATESTPTKIDKGKSPAKSFAIADPATPGVIEAKSSLPQRNKPKHQNPKPEVRREPAQFSGRTIEQHTREMYAQMVGEDSDFGFKEVGRFFQEAVQELEEELHSKEPEKAGPSSQGRSDNEPRE